MSIRIKFDGDFLSLLLESRGLCHEIIINTVCFINENEKDLISVIYSKKVVSKLPVDDTLSIDGTFSDCTRIR